MCGITGFINPRPDAEARALLERMNTALLHRGPDDAGVFLTPAENDGPQVGLAMRRLAIIDLQTGHQPIANEDETAWIVFNGEIYNHASLRRELEGRGHRFRTHSDTEAILHAYEEYGVECLRHLRGMFAFAIWDERRQRLFLVRDPVGIKPLYWTRVGGSFLFASEIKALLVHAGVAREVDETALSDYLTYLYVPPPRTMFAGISKVPPGHRLVWERGEVTVEEYWAGPASLLGDAPQEPVGAPEVWEAIRESVRAHLLSDVPLGAFLSGGLDSLAVVSAMQEVCEEPAATFTVGFENGGLYNELDAARAAAAHLRTRHHELVIGPECVRELPEIVRMLDEPLADASVLPNHAVAGLARQKVTVALSGAGGDELFGGYQRYRGEALAVRWQRVPGALRRSTLLPLLRRLPNAGDTRLGEKVRLAQKLLEPLDLPPEQRYVAWNTFFGDVQKASLFAKGTPSGDGSTEASLRHFARVRHRPFVDQAMYVDLRTYLPGDPLFLADRMTMAHSLEGRVPFVDRELMELAYRVPARQKIRGKVTKAIVREALAGRVPDALLRAPKRGFGTPTDVWLRGPWRALAEEILSPESLLRAGHFEPSAVRQLLAEHQGGGRDLSQHLWALIVFHLWHRLHIEPARPPDRPVSLADLGIGEARFSPAPSRRPPASLPKAPEPARIAVFRAGGIGDTLSVLPALRALRATYPQAKVCLLTSRIGAGLLWNDGGPPLADEVLALDALYNKTPGEVPIGVFREQLRRYRDWARRFSPDVFVCCHELHEWRNTLRPALLASLSGSPRRLGRAAARCYGWFLTERISDSRWTCRSIYDRNLDIVRLLSCDTDGGAPRLIPGPAALEWAREQSAAIPGPQRIATLHLLGSRASRHWPVEHFSALAAWLRERYGLTPCLVGAASERPVLEKAAEELGGAPVIFPPDLERTAAWLAQSALVVGSDSGVVHMAVAVGTPTVAIFGPGEHQLWGYWGNPRYAMARIELPCWPCYRPSCGARSCLARLPVPEVQRAVARVLEGRAPINAMAGAAAAPELIRMGPR